MTARRIYLTPPIAADISCANCDAPLVVAAKVVYSDGKPSWFVFEHTDGECPEPTPADPFDAPDSCGLIEPLFAAAVAAGATSVKSPQTVRVDEALERLFNAEAARKEFVAAGDHASASEAMNAMRGVIEDLPLRDVRSLAMRLFVRAVKAGA